MPSVVFHHRDFRRIDDAPEIDDVISYAGIEWRRTGVYRQGIVGAGERMDSSWHPSYPLYEPLDTRLRLFVSPADLASELGVPQKRIRDYLRFRYGTLPTDEDRWRLEPAEADDVRGHFTG